MKRVAEDEAVAAPRKRRAEEALPSQLAAFDVQCAFAGKETLMQVIACLADKQGSKKKGATAPSPYFTFCKVEDKWFLRAQTQDSAMCCFTEAKIACKVRFRDRARFEAQSSFSVPCSKLSNAVEVAPARLALNILRIHNNPKVFVASVDDSGRARSCTSLAEEDVSAEYVQQLTTMRSYLAASYDHSVSMLTKDLASITHFCAKESAAVITIVLGCLAADPTKQFIQMSASYDDGSNFHEKFYMSSCEIHSDKEETVFKDEADGSGDSNFTKSNIQIMYMDRFSTALLLSACSHVKSRTMTLRFMEDCPLVVHAPLADDRSDITFVISPKEKEELTFTSFIMAD